MQVRCSARSWGYRDEETWSFTSWNYSQQGDGQMNSDTATASCIKRSRVGVGSALVHWGKLKVRGSIGSETKLGGRIGSVGSQEKGWQHGVKVCPLAILSCQRKEGMFLIGGPSVLWGQQPRPWLLEVKSLGAAEPVTQLECCHLTLLPLYRCPLGITAFTLFLTFVVETPVLILFLFFS